MGVSGKGPPEPRPGLKVMPEYTVDMPVWHGPGSDDSGNVGAEELTALGVSGSLVQRLRAWQESWDHDRNIEGSPPRESWPGSPLTVRLARQLQAELPDYRVFLFTYSGLRPVEDWAD